MGFLLLSPLGAEGTDVDRDVTIAVTVKFLINVDPILPTVDHCDTGEVRGVVRLGISRRETRGPIGAGLIALFLWLARMGELCVISSRGIFKRAVAPRLGVFVFCWGFSPLIFFFNF